MGMHTRPSERLPLPCLVSPYPPQIQPSSSYNQITDNVTRSRAPILHAATTLILSITLHAQTPTPTPPAINRNLIFLDPARGCARHVLRRVPP